MTVLPTPAIMSRQPPYSWCRPIEDLDPGIFGEVLRRLLETNPTTSVVELRYRVICDGGYRWLDIAIVSVMQGISDQKAEDLWPKLDLEVTRAARIWANTIPVVSVVSQADTETIGLYRPASSRKRDLPAPPVWPSCAAVEGTKQGAPRSAEPTKTEAAPAAPPAAPPAQASLF